MGVMLSLDQPRLARNRRRARHARRPDDQAWAEALAAILRDDLPHPGCLARLAKTVLAGRLVPAAPGAGRPAGPPAAGQEPGRDIGRAPGGRPPRAGRGLSGGAPGLSGACLLGQCDDSPGAPACASADCQHDCHDRRPAPCAAGDPPASSVA